MSNIERLIVSSLDKTEFSQTGSNFTVRLGEHIEKITHISVYQCSIPFTWYTFRSGTTFNYKITIIPDGEVMRSITMPDRKFDSVSDLVTWLNAESTIAGDSLVFSYNANNGKLTITSTESIIIPNNTTLASYPNSINRQLGFYHNSTEAYATSNVASNIVSLLPTQMIYLSCAELDCNVTSTRARHGGNIIAVIPINGNSFGDLIGIQAQPTSKDFLTVNGHENQKHSQLSFRLLDDNGNELELNGSEIEIVINFYYMKNLKTEVNQSMQTQPHHQIPPASQLILMN